MDAQSPSHISGEDPAAMRLELSATSVHLIKKCYSNRTEYTNLIYCHVCLSLCLAFCLSLHPIQCEIHFVDVNITPSLPVAAPTSQHRSMPCLWHFAGVCSCSCAQPRWPLPKQDGDGGAQQEPKDVNLPRNRTVTHFNGTGDTQQRWG